MKKKKNIGKLKKKSITILTICGVFLCFLVASFSYTLYQQKLRNKVLKEAGVYKPNRGEVPQGGLGGVGIENWILQNGGSFIDAARSFIEAAEGKTFEQFKDTYKIWDFGENHLAEKRGKYVHDNFVTGNMSEQGYNKMNAALKEYLLNLSKSQAEQFDEQKISK